MAELSDVTKPLIGAHRVHSGARDEFYVLAEQAVEMLDKMGDEGGDCLAPLAKRRDQGSRIEFADLLLLALACDRQEPSRQQWYVAPPCAQRWKLDRESRESVVEVGAKPARCDRGLEIAVGRGEYPHVDLLGPRIADRDDLAVLKHAQQRRLHRERHFADLVEKNDPAGRGAEESGLIAVRPGAVSPTMTQHLPLSAP